MTAPLTAPLPPALPTPARATPRLAVLVASMGGVGRLRPAPGTWGSALVLPLAWLGPGPCMLAAVLFTLAGVLAVGRLPRAQSDPPWVVVDEAAGQSLALAALAPQAGLLWVLAAFLLFRFFDILKPPPVRWADRRDGPVWVMLDDVLAGALAAAVLAIARSVL
ncbi:phosphatidylglycerophosphatase A [Roseomonas gilardii]|uniref:phosphatidylglycerophosphatase A family protein n=1 Tax=Roseomonas gilardii TaxID=257708 RepID=UPI0009F85C34|nr:phosphatidylglycerophosphatase A [Roseomonas gilardii]